MLLVLQEDDKDATAMDSARLLFETAALRSGYGVKVCVCMCVCVCVCVYLYAELHT